MYVIKVAVVRLALCYSHICSYLLPATAVGCCTNANSRTVRQILLSYLSTLCTQLKINYVHSLQWLYKWKKSNICQKENVEFRRVGNHFCIAWNDLGIILNFLFIFVLKLIICTLVYIHKYTTIYICLKKNI